MGINTAITNSYGSTLPGGMKVGGTLTVAGDLTAEAKTFLNGGGTDQDGLMFGTITETETTDDTETTVFTRPLDDDTTYGIEVKVIGVEEDGSNRASFHRSIVVYREGGGNATIQGLEYDIHSETSDLDWDVALDVDGTNFEVNVAGIAATKVKWTGHVIFTNGVF